MALRAIAPFGSVQPCPVECGEAKKRFGAVTGPIFIGVNKMSYGEVVVMYSKLFLAPPSCQRFS